VSADSFNVSRIGTIVAVSISSNVAAAPGNGMGPGWSGSDDGESDCSTGLRLADVEREDGRRGPGSDG
jgi:hypothetical protein